MAQLKFRSDDTIKWPYGFGDFFDGDLDVTVNTTKTTIDATCTGTDTTYSLSATNASFEAGQYILISQTRGTTGYGEYQFNRILSYTAGTITTVLPLTQDYITGAQVIVMERYRTVTIRDGVYLAPKDYVSGVGGILAFFCDNLVTEGTGYLNLTGTAGGYSAGGGAYGFVTGRGFEGGRGFQRTSGPAGGVSGGGYSYAPNFRGGSAVDSGGGDSYEGNNSNRSDGAGGGMATAGTNGYSPAYTIYGGLALSITNGLLLTLAGGGGGGRSGSTNNGNGGTGGGASLICARNITFSTDTGYRADYRGGAGGHSGAGSVAGSGASGMGIFKCEKASIGTSKITADAVTTYADGGKGYIHFDYSVSLSGTSSPTLTSRNDLTVVQSTGSSFLFNLL